MVLVRQYATGIKHPSAEQAAKLQAAIKAIGQVLKNVSLYA